jgi:ABC-type glycerol-3-phosphate transport system permease component
MTATTTSAYQQTANQDALRRFNRAIRRSPLYLILIILALIDIFPLLWIGLSSFKTQGEIFRYPPTFLPKDATLNNYQEALGLLPPTNSRSPKFHGLPIAVIATLPRLILILVHCVCLRAVLFQRSVYFFILLFCVCYPWVWCPLVLNGYPPKQLIQNFSLSSFILRFNRASYCC